MEASRVMSPKAAVTSGTCAQASSSLVSYSSPAKAHSAAERGHGTIFSPLRPGRRLRDGLSCLLALAFGSAVGEGFREPDLLFASVSTLDLAINSSSSASMLMPGASWQGRSWMRPPLMSEAATHLA